MPSDLLSPHQALSRAQGPALANALADMQLWQHRKVESLRLMEGLHGRRRVSIDCTPPIDKGLAYGPARTVQEGRDPLEDRLIVRLAKAVRRWLRYPSKGTSLDGAASALGSGGTTLGEPGSPEQLRLLPLAFIGKGTLRHFDITAGDGRSLPVLGRRENADAATAALASELIGIEQFENADKLAALRRIVDGFPATSIPLGEELFDRGTVGGVAITDPESISIFGTTLVKRLAENFLLVTLLPEADAGARQVLKYSFHWLVQPGASQGALGRLLVFGGFSAAPLAVEVSGPEAAESYHLEVHAPPGLLTAGLTLPASETGLTSVAADDSVDVIAHAVGSYTDRPGDVEARVQLLVPGAGLRLLTALVLAYTSATMALMLFLPGAKGALLGASDGAAAVLLAVPAVVVALLTRQGENVIAARLLMPYRVAVTGCAIALVAVGASIVGVLHEPYMHALWWTVFSGTTITGAFLTVGLIVGGE